MCLTTDWKVPGWFASLKRGPAALGYETALWTSVRVADLIERETGVRYHPGHVWKILRQLGWSCQRPTSRALERNISGAISSSTRSPTSARAT